MLHRLKHLGAGLTMGLAGLFPGVSAGTVALLLGIHSRLIHAIAGIDHRLPRDLFSWIRGNTEARAALGKLDLGFVFTIIAGMLLTTFSGARAVTWLQQNYPGPVMAVFLGLIGFGSLIPWRRIDAPGWKEVAFLVPGAAIALLLAMAPAGSLGTGIWLFFIGGMVAMPMMILPGVSGSALLVTLGLYADAIQAAGDFNVPYLLVFAAGGTIGILTSAKGLKWLLDHHHSKTMAFLTGLLAGSIYRVWPWRTVEGFALGRPAAPDHDVWWIVWTAAASVLVLFLERRGRLATKSEDSAPAPGPQDESYQ